jgi:hypothetical protein
MEKREAYQGFEFVWQEPPMTTGGRQVSIAGASRDNMDALHRATGEHGSKVITGRDLADALAQAKAFVDGLLG